MKVGRLVKSKRFEQEIHQLIAASILDPDFSYRIDRIRIIPKKSKHGAEYPVVCIEISTNNRPLLLGQFLHFPIHGRRGSYAEWMEGYLAGYVSRELKTQPHCEFHIEAFPMQGKKNLGYGYRHLALDKAISHGIMPLTSPLTTKMKEYGLNWILLEGSVIAGPDLDLILTIERFLRHDRVESMLDLFCGTGSLTKVALMNGAKNAVCIDTSVKAARDNLRGFEDRVEILECDAFSYTSENRTYDLVVADPFLDLSHMAAKVLSPKFSRKCRTFMLTVGFVEDLYWQQAVLEELRSWFTNVAVLDHGRLVQALCSN